MTYAWHDMVGNVGVVMILATYLLVQLDRLDVRLYSYSILNGLGALLIILSLAFEFNLSAFLMEAAWVAVSCYGLMRRYRLNPG